MIAYTYDHAWIFHGMSKVFRADEAQNQKESKDDA